jgi:DNA-binding NtrC family response regulator
MGERLASFDDRESFVVAEAALNVVRNRTEEYPDEGAVWDAFIRGRGKDDAEYLRRIREGGKVIFYSLVQDLHAFAEKECGTHIAEEVGEALTAELLRRHLPDLLQAMMGLTGPLPEKILWLIRRFLSGTTGEIYVLEQELDAGGKVLNLGLAYRFEKEMREYLERAGHNPEDAFRRSFLVVRGALLSLAGRTISGFDAGRVESELSGLRGRMTLHFSDENRFNYEEFIDILLDYVRALRSQGAAAVTPAGGEDAAAASPAMQSAWERIRKASRSGETVLLCGESGTGKSFYARKIHRISPRSDGPFVEVGLTSDVGSDNLIQSNLFGHVRGAFTGAGDEKRGLFSLAHGGTIFLDEIGDASPELQAKLLRVLETKRFKMLGGVEDIGVDVNVIAATNRDLPALVESGSFRQDLYYRLNVIQIEIPALRDRREDIPPLLLGLFEKIARDTGKPEKRLSAEAKRILCSTAWPGNVRQMENALRHALAMSEGEEITPADLPPLVLSEAGPAPETGPVVVNRGALRSALSETRPAEGAPSHDWAGHVNHARREYLRALIEHHGGNLSRVAEHWDRSSENTIRKLVREFGLEEELGAARKGE